MATLLTIQVGRRFSFPAPAAALRRALLPRPPSAPLLLLLPQHLPLDVVGLLVRPQQPLHLLLYFRQLQDLNNVIIIN